jgi:signal transduction histidine kinase
MPRSVPRPVDLIVAATLTVATQLELWLGTDPGASRAVLSAGYLLGTISAAWHRLAPLVTLTISLTGLVLVPGLLGVDPAASISWFVTMLWVIASAGYHARRPLLALAIAFGVLAASITVEKGFAPGDIVYAWLIAGGAWLAGRALASRTLQASLAEERAARAEREAEWRAAAAVTDERLRIARELHDLTAHSISVMTLHVSGVRRLLRPDQVNERAALESAERTGRESLAEMHRLLGVLRTPAAAPDQPEPQPGLSRVGDLLQSARAAGLTATLEITGDLTRLSPALDLVAYRIVQEAVTNVLRHASASRLDCRIVIGPTQLELWVTDDGRGLTGEARVGHGHAGMRERVQLYSGSLDIGPQPGGGFAVRAVLPLPSTVKTPQTQSVS